MRRRQVTTAITMIVLCGVLVLGAVWGFKSLFADIPEAGLGNAEPSPTCKTQKFNAGEPVKAAQIQVSVFNAGNRSGLASTTLNSLANRGFQIGDAGNAPSDAKVSTVQVWSTHARDIEAKLVALQFGKGTPVKRSDVDLGPGVDVVVGNGYHGLAKAPTSLRASSAEEVCVPVDRLSTAAG
jgi:hypothetical protein